MNGRGNVGKSGSVPIDGGRARRRGDGLGGSRGGGDGRGRGRRLGGGLCRGLCGSLDRGCGVRGLGLGLRALNGVREEFQDLADNLFGYERHEHLFNEI